MTNRIVYLFLSFIIMISVYGKEESINEKKTIKYATWYGGKFHGRKTSSGEIYNMYGMTAAHRTLPFGTKVKITNPKNNKYVIVRINDRGPFQKKYSIDLTYAAFQKIKSKNSGEVQVYIDVLDKNTDINEETIMDEIVEESVKNEVNDTSTVIAIFLEETIINNTTNTAITTNTTIEMKEDNEQKLEVKNEKINDENIAKEMSNNYASSRFYFDISRIHCRTK